MVAVYKAGLGKECWKQMGRQQAPVQVNEAQAG